MTKPLRPLDPHNYPALLRRAGRLLETRPYQAEFIAGKMQPTRNGAMKLQFCATDDPEAALSMRGALILAAGSGPRAWAVMQYLDALGMIKRDEPPTREEALDRIKRAYATATYYQRENRKLMYAAE